jgi:SanA protein
MIALLVIRKLFKWSFFTFILLLISGSLCFYWIENSTAKNLYENTTALPECKSGLVLGTSRYLAGGSQNLYFTYRIEAAARLFAAKKIKKLILSGDNRVNDYNEPKEMKKALLAKGIPDSCIVLDYAGLRTFDSMVRCKEIFGQDSVIVVSQQFHNARAIFIAKRIGLTAFGFNAQKVTTQKTFKMKTREFFSRIKCVLDIYLFNTRPRHLGEKISI